MRRRPYTPPPGYPADYYPYGHDGWWPVSSVVGFALASIVAAAIYGVWALVAWALFL
jgi:hypothetical protein